MKKIITKIASLALAFNLFSPGLIGSVQAEEAKSHSGNITIDVDLSDQEAGKEVKLWLPYVKSDDYQEISNVNVELDETNAKQELTEDEKGNQILYIEWTPEATERKVSYSFDVVRQEVLRPELKEEGEVDTEEFAEFLEGNVLMPVDGEVKELADSIVEGKTTVLDKAQAIYDWIYDNMERNNDVVGCGLGDVKQLLVSLDGKCTDIHSVFISLARSVGIPARETFGFRMSEDPEADVTTTQHCWAEFYLPGTGWVSIDVADVLKKVLNDELDKASEEALELKEYFFGNLEPMRVGLTTGRMLTLNPAQDAAPINNFGYPYAEVDGQPVDFYKPEEFKYTITYKASEEAEESETEETTVAEETETEETNAAEETETEETNAAEETETDAK